MSIDSVMLSEHLILCHPLLLLPSVFPASGFFFFFSNEQALRIGWPKYWTFSFSISPSSKYTGLISLRKDWSDLLAVQGTLKSLLHHHNLKASVLWCSAFFMVQLSHLYITAVKTITLTSWTFVISVQIFLSTYFFCYVDGLLLGMYSKMYQSFISWHCRLLLM